MLFRMLISGVGSKEGILCYMSKRKIAYMFTYSIDFIGITIFFFDFLAKLLKLFSIPLKKMIRMPSLPLHKHKMLIELSIRCRYKAIFRS
jgi:hypothetical protein